MDDCYEKCPVCKLYGIPKHFTKEIIKPIYVPPGSPGITSTRNKVRFCIYCNTDFLEEE